MFFCICDEEMCFCTHMVDEPEKACEDCAAGKHVWSPE